MAFLLKAMQPDDRMRKTELAHSRFSEGIASTRTGKIEDSSRKRSTERLTSNECHVAVAIGVRIPTGSAADQ
jgi:hypothetical protein